MTVGQDGGVLAHGHPGEARGQCLALGTDVGPQWAACSARLTLMFRSGGPVMAGSGRAGAGAGGSGTHGLRISRNRGGRVGSSGEVGAAEGVW
jgi:hypothetical protein